MNELFDAICSSRHCAAFTGAGVSVPSGLPCFRDGGLGGEWSAISESHASRVEKLVRDFFGPSADPGWEELFSLECFERDPALFYEKASPFLYHDKKPSIVHTVLAELEKRGHLKAVITQNIDRLHQAAGSRNVTELHGSPAFHYCMRCAGIRLPFGEAAAVVAAGKLPLCPHCGRILKPAVTLYGEPLPLEARRAAQSRAEDADLLLVLGTSLKVKPAADIPRAALRRGGKIVIVNRQPTDLDGEAFLRYYDLEKTFSEILKFLEETK
jgi:NAD-dependent deacetylase